MTPSKPKKKGKSKSAELKGELEQALLAFAQAEVEKKPVKIQKKRLKFHLKRVPAEIREAGSWGRKTQVKQARVFLNDIGSESIWFYSKERLYMDQKITLTLEIPARLFVKGIIRSCQQISHSNRVVFSDPYPYRVTMDLIFETANERDAVRGIAKEFQLIHVFRD